MFSKFFQVGGVVTILTLFITGACSPSSSTTTKTTSQPTTPAKKIITETDFENVCNGSKVEDAAAYDKTAGTISPVYLFAREDKSKSYTSPYLSDIPKDWKVSYEEITKNQLVTCITATNVKEVRKCDYPDDKDSNKTYVLTMNDASYEVKVYEAKTGVLVDEKSFDLKADAECPMFYYFSDMTGSSNPSYTQTLIDYINPFIRH